jgi:signal transduction histidine kinase
MLHAFLIANRGDLIHRCRAKVSKRSNLPANHARLEYGIPLFLDQITETLRRDVTLHSAENLKSSGAPLPDTEIGVTAGKHGNELLRMGCTIDHVVHDYGDLCQAVTELALIRKVPITVEEFHTFNRCLDNAIAGAVTAYANGHDVAVSDQGRQSTNERLGSLAHEMRNLLNSVVLTLDVIKKGSVGFGGSTAAALDRNLAAMRDLIDRSFTETRLEAGLPPVRERIPVDEFIQHVQIAAALEARSKSVGFTVHPVEEGLVIEADRQTLSAAVSNLLQNAFKFTRPHGHVSLKAHATHDRVFIAIEDECGGLPPGKAAELFKPFHQRAADRSGLGLGLSITYRSVEANGGRLQVRDKPGTGCVFTIDLPRQFQIRSSDQHDPAIVVLGLIGRLKGATARAGKLSPGQRPVIVKLAVPALEASNAKTSRLSPDKHRIHVSDPNGLRNWARSLHTTPDAIKAAVAKVGTLAYKVREQLKGR